LAPNGVLIAWPKTAYCWIGSATPHRRFEPPPDHHAGDAAAGCHDRRQPRRCLQLGEAYAFGVVWSFFFKSLGVLALRYQRHDQEYKVPLICTSAGWRFHRAGRHHPDARFRGHSESVFKTDRHHLGVTFTLVVFIVFTISRAPSTPASVRVCSGEEASRGVQSRARKKSDHTVTLHARPGCVLVAARDYHNMDHLKKVLQKNQSAAGMTLLVMTVRHYLGWRREYDLSDELDFLRYERELFSHVVEVPRGKGKPVGTAGCAGCESRSCNGAIGFQITAGPRLVTGVSARMPSENSPAVSVSAWEKSARAASSLLSRDHPSRPRVDDVNLGPHPPRFALKTSTACTASGCG